MSVDTGIHFPAPTFLPAPRSHLAHHHASRHHPNHDGRDNAEQVKKGKELFTGAITGLLFIIFSVTLLKIIAGDIIQLPGF
jgi:hypothetical protein